MVPIKVVNAVDFRPEEVDRYRYVFLAEGDSWFSYGSHQMRNILNELEFPQPSLVVNLAKPGDTLHRMHSSATNEAFYSYLENKNGRKWDAIFFSCGGNDLIDATWNLKENRSEILQRVAHPEFLAESDLPAVLNEGDFALLLSYVEKNLKQVVTQGRDRPGWSSNGVPMFIHTYAKLQPRNSPVAIFGGGPWLYPACRWLGLPEHLWMPLATLLLSRSRDLVMRLRLPNVHVINTLDDVPLVPSNVNERGSSGDWENEIHPNRAGYVKLARHWADRIRAVIG